MSTLFSSNTALRIQWIPYDDQSEAIRLASLACQSLIAEVGLTPKPGLVDRRGAGAHSDLSLSIMKRSAITIEPYFRQMAVYSKRAHPSQSLREQLAVIGREAERAMFRATGGCNSHRGAIWILGLLVSAAAMQKEDEMQAGEIAEKGRQIASFADRAAPRLVTHGDLVAKTYGVTGARGESLRGFPHVVEIGLPTLRAKRANGATESVARLDTLLSIMSSLDDTCLLYRGGPSALNIAKSGAAAVGRAGGSGTPKGKQRLVRLDRRLLKLGASPGGSGDLLAATLFLDAIERRLDEVQPDGSEAEDQDGAT
jgi:triphosphoribosyl-dephospho-CoA synthase